MTPVLLHAWPIVVVYSLAGWGWLAYALMREDSKSDLFSCAFMGMAVVVLAAGVVNLGEPLGRNPAWVFTAPALLASGWALLRHASWRRSSGWLLLATAAILYAWRHKGLGHDTGMYHIPYMQWLAQEQLPLGLANLFDPLGFNSAWLLLCAAFRLDALHWNQLLDCEVAIAALCVARCLASVRPDAAARPVNLIRLFAAISIAWVIRSANVQTGTDLAGNLLVCIAWVIFSEHLFGSSAAGAQRAAALDLMLVVPLSVLFKLSLLPAALLLVFFEFNRRLKFPPSAMSIRTGGAVGALLVLTWLGRSFMQSGCLVFPAAATCLDVGWRVPDATVRQVSADITGWARAPGEGFRGHSAMADLTWLPGWLHSQHGGPYQLALAAIVLWVAARLFFRRQAATRPMKLWQLQTGAFVLAGLGLWFVKAPDVRFSWAYFAVMAAALFASAVMRLRPTMWHNLALPHIPAAPVLLLGAVAVSVASLLREPVNVPAGPAAPAVPALSAIAVPRPRQLCWETFPCAQYKVDDLRVSREGSRLTFARKVDGSGTVPAWAID